MNCNYCNTENPDEAVFCKECGKRLDGKTVCKECGAAFEGSYCPACGTPAARKETEIPLWKKIVEICASSLGLVAALCSLLFVFFIGFGVGGSPNFEKALQDMGIAGIQINDIYYFFGEGYKDVAALLEGLESYTPLFEISLYLPVIFGTAITAAMLVAVPVLSVLAIVKLVQKLAGKKVKGDDKLVLASYFTFVTGTVLLLALEYFSVSATQSISSSFSYATNVTGGIVMNSATVAGLVLGGVFTGLFAACKVAVKGKSLISPPVLLKMCFSLASVVLLAVVLTLAGQSAGGFTVIAANGTSSASLSFPNIMQFIGINNVVSEKPEAATAFSLVCCAYIAQTALIILIAVATIKICTNFSDEKHSSGLGLAIAVCAVAALSLIFSITAGMQAAVQCLGDPLPEAISLFFTPVMVTLALTVVYLVMSVVHAVMKKKMIDSAE